MIQIGLWQYEVEGEGTSKGCVIGYRLLAVVIAPLLLNALSLRTGNYTLSSYTLGCVLTIHVHNDIHTCINTHTHTHTHTYIYTHTYTQKQ